MIDDYDFMILKAFSKLSSNEQKPLSSWKVMKNIFNDGKERENEKIKKRVKKMEKMGLFLIEENSNKICWIMNKDNVKFQIHKFPDGKYNSVVLKIYGKWEAKQL